MIRSFAVPLCALALAASLASPLPAQKALSLDEAVAAALGSDPGIISANLDSLFTKAKAESASWKRIPSLTASASGQYLGEQSATTINLGSATFTLPPGLNHSYSFGLNLQYPVFAGFRVKESIAIADLQAESKDVAREAVLRSLAFDVRRAYWEAVRATYNRATLEKNLELMKQNSDLATRQLGQGVATRADQLAAQMRLEQATEDLNDALAQQKRAFLTLASLTGADLASLRIAAEGASMPFELSTKPDDAALAVAAAAPGAAPGAAQGALPLDEAALISQALARRPETRNAALAGKLAEHSIELARAALYPTVALTGNLSVADPNQRAIVQQEAFVTTGSIGLVVNYDIGGLPIAMTEIKAQGLAASKAKSDEERQRRAIVLDVEACVVNLARAMSDLESTRAMVAQAEENLRVVQGRIAAGTAKDIDLSTSSFDLLRINFAVTNKRIDLLIAQADLARATASEDLK